MLPMNGVLPPRNPVPENWTVFVPCDSSLGSTGIEKMNGPRARLVGTNGTEWAVPPLSR